MRDERRVITAVFADLAGSTEIAERLDTEEVKLVVGEAIARIVVEIERLGGYVKDLAGDGVLAFFGAPVSHEDDAERALRASLGILESIAAYSLEVRRGWGIETFGVRIGVATGSVALGSIGAGQRLEYAAYGDTVNTAARLQAEAAVGSALVDVATRHRLKASFEWSDPQTLSLKGKAEPVSVFRLGAALPTKARSSGLGEVSQGIVGRDAERLILHHAVDDVRAGRGAIVSIHGRAGLGKSRLLADARAQAQIGVGPGPTILWLEGRCASYGEEVPYFPFRDLLTSWLEVSESDPEVRLRVALRRHVDLLFDGDRDEVYTCLAALLRVTGAGDGFGVLDIPAEERQQRTFAAIGVLLDRLAESRPLVVALEDLHWADATSTRLARALLPVVERSAVLLVMTQRDERDGEAWGLKEAAARDFPHLHHDISLDSLLPGPERELLYELVGAGTLPDHLEHRLLEAADGNPLFLEELVQSLVDAGALVQLQQGGWQLERDVPIVIPETVERVILARVDRLSTECRDVLTAASVVGRRFDLAVLSGLVSSPESLTDALHDLQRLGFVVQERRWPEPEYRFRHVLIQEAVYRTMLSEHRARLHRAAAETLERRTGETQQDVLALARHWDVGGEAEQALPYYRRGAELAIRAFANEEAAETLRHALDLLSEAEDGPERDETELEVRIMLGVPIVARGGWGTAEVRENYLRAAELCRLLGRPLSPPILRGLAISSVIRLELEDARQHGEALLDIATRERSALLGVEANYVLGVTAFWVGEFSESRDFLAQAIATYSPDQHATHIALYSQDPKVVCLCRLAWTMWILGDPAQAAALRDEAVALAEELGHPFSLGHAYSFGAVISRELQDEHATQRLLGALGDLIAHESLQFWELFYEVYRHWPRAASDPQAIDEMKSAIVRFADTGQTLWRTYFLSMVTRAYLLVGDATSALETVTHSLAETERTGAWYLGSELHRLHGEVLQAIGVAPGEVEAALSRAEDLAARQGAKALELRAVVARGTWSLGRGAVERRDASRRLAAVCAWFEDKEDPALTAARQLLDQLS